MKRICASSWIITKNHCMMNGQQNLKLRNTVKHPRRTRVTITPGASLKYIIILSTSFSRRCPKILLVPGKGLLRPLVWLLGWHYRRSEICELWKHFTKEHSIWLACHLYSIYFGRFQWPRGLRRVSAAARLLVLRVRISPGAWKSVSCECCVLSGIGLCVGLISRPEESHQVWCVFSVIVNPR